MHKMNLINRLYNFVSSSIQMYNSSKYVPTPVVVYISVFEIDYRATVLDVSRLEATNR